MQTSPNVSSFTQYPYESKKLELVEKGGQTSGFVSIDKKWQSHKDRWFSTALNLSYVVGVDDVNIG